MSKKVRCYIGWGPAYQCPGHAVNDGLCEPQKSIYLIEDTLRGRCNARDVEIFRVGDNTEIEFTLNFPDDMDNFFSINRFYEIYPLKEL